MAISKTSDVRAFARFVAPLQADPKSRSGSFGMDAIGIATELEEYETSLFIERDATGNLIGAVGFDYDEPLARGFVYGPWSTAPEWNKSADRMLERALSDAPQTMRTVDIAFDIANERTGSLATRRGFRLVRDHFTMVFDDGEATLELDPLIRVMTPADRAAVSALHERCFEGTWPSGQQLLERLDGGPDRRIFVVYEGDVLAGYHFASVDRETGEALIENIGVDEAFRGRGIATRLLRHGLVWFFSFDEVQRIELSVRQENEAAIKVYENAGFRKAWAIRQMRLDVD